MFSDVHITILVFGKIFFSDITTKILHVHFYVVSETAKITTTNYVDITHTQE